MAIRQISVFVDNKPGRLCKLTSLMAEHRIDMRALCLADTADYGIMRLLTADTKKLQEILVSEGYLCKINHVVAVSVDDTPGGLAKVVSILGENGVNIEYLYAFVLRSNRSACVVFRFGDNAAAEKILAENGVRMLSQEDIDAI